MRDVVNGACRQVDSNALRYLAWAFGHDDQRQGLVVTIDDYPAFAKQVRQELWNGL